MRVNQPERILRDVGRRVAELRAVRGLTQEKLAEVAGVSARYIQEVEGGRENLTLVTLAQIADYLRVPFRELLKPPQSRRVRRGRPPKKRSRPG